MEAGFTAAIRRVKNYDTTHCELEKHIAKKSLINRIRRLESCVLLFPRKTSH